MAKDKALSVNVDKNRLPNGKFAPGNVANPHGRPRKPEVEELREALDWAQKKNRKSFLKHFVERAFKNDQVAIALAKKIIPDKFEGEGFGDQIQNLFQNIQIEGRSFEEIVNEVNSRLSAQFARKP